MEVIKMKMTVTEIKNGYIYTNTKQMLWGVDVQVGDVLEMTLDEDGVMTKLVRDGITLYEEK